MSWTIRKNPNTLNFRSMPNFLVSYEIILDEENVLTKRLLMLSVVGRTFCVGDDIFKDECHIEETNIGLNR